MKLSGLLAGMLAAASFGSGSCLGAKGGAVVHKDRYVVQKTGVSDPDPPEPAQPADFAIFITNFCNSTATLSTSHRNLWEGSFAVDPPDTVASHFSPKFKYGFEVVADPNTARINGTLLYETPFLFLDFFAVEHEWGLEVEYTSAASAVVAQADIGNISVYNVIIGQGQQC